MFVRALTDTSAVVLAKDYTLQHVTNSGVVTPLPSIDDALRMTTVPVTDMRAGPNGTIWLCNPSGQAVVVSTKTGAPTKAYRDGCYKVAPRPDGGAVFLRDPVDDDWVRVVARDGTTISRLRPILEDQSDYGRAALDGRSVSAGGALIHVPNHLSFIAAFGLHGGVQYLVKGVESDSHPQVRVGPGRVIVERPPSSWWLQDAIVREGAIVSLIARTIEGTKEGGLDIYEAKTGQYMHSVKLPAYSMGLALLPHTMYTIEADGGLSLRKVKWREVMALG